MFLIVKHLNKNFCLTFENFIFIYIKNIQVTFYFMQVQNQQENSLHQVVTDTVSDLYDGIDSIIEAAKSYIQVETVQDAEKLVDYIDSYVKIQGSSRIFKNTH